MTDLIPNIKGPKLFPFPEDIRNVVFVRLLSSEDGSSTDTVPHGRVFEVELDGKQFALKVFNFFSIEEIRPFAPEKEHLLDDHIVRHQIDPFFAECRAFGRLCQDGKDDLLAVRCYGYIYLPKEIELRIKHQFGISDWNRKAGDNGLPLRAIMKDLIRFKGPFGRKKFPYVDMRKKLEQLYELAIFNMDICERNYLGGRLFDFSIAITAPHISLWEKLRPRRQILDDMHDDIECFNSMIEEIRESTKDTENPWVNRLRQRA